MSDQIRQDIAIKGEGNIVVGKGDVVINPLPPAEARLRHDLDILLRNVENTWIKGVFEKSVYQATLLELGMETRAKAVDSPWSIDIEGPEQPRETLPRDRRIKDVFDEANRFLLILGDPGSGKTTTLLQLARDLIAEVDQAFTQPVPVVFNLSTWTDKQSLDNWIITELNSKYFLPQRQGKQWLEERRILPLLDGLDEVNLEHRGACVEAINQLVLEYGLQGIVVCSRLKDYTDLDVRLVLYRAIYLQPLTAEQIYDYFERIGNKLANLRETLRRDKALQNLARSPLMLNIMGLAYEGTPDEKESDFNTKTDESNRHRLFDIYIARMFKRKGDRWSYKAEETREKLSWIARNMQLHNQDVFLLESLQPSWLQTRRWRIFYILASRLLGGLLAGLIFGLIFLWNRGLSDGLIVGLSVGLSVWLPISIVDVLRFEWLDKWRERNEVSQFWWSVINIVVVGLVFGLIFGMFEGIGSQGSNIRLCGYLGSVRYCIRLNDALIIGLIVGLIFELRSSQKNLMNDIQAVEALRWDWGKAFKGGLLAGLIVGFLTVLGFGLAGVLHEELIFLGSVFGLIVVPFSAVFYGFSRGIIETKTSPNQGIRLSIKYAVLGGLIVGSFLGLLIGLFGGLGIGFFGGLLFGFVGAFWYGGLDIIQHYTLRLILIIQGHTPRKYVHFLNTCVDLIFLQRVGGGYRFIHRMLLEHFAEMDKTDSKLNS